jgi:hypothetical protein
MGTARVGPLAHMGYVFRQLNRRAYGHHVSRQTKPGAWCCGVCGRWVVRGMGRWWERFER